MRALCECAVLLQCPKCPTLSKAVASSIRWLSAVVSSRISSLVQTRETLAAPRSSAATLIECDSLISRSHSCIRLRAKQNQGETDCAHARSYMRGWAVFSANKLAGGARALDSLADLSARFPNLLMRTRVRNFVYRENRSSDQSHIMEPSSHEVLQMLRWPTPLSNTKQSEAARTAGRASPY